MFHHTRAHETRWGAHALEHLIEIYISPNGDHLWEVATAAASGDGSSSESLGVARFFLSELEKMGRGDGRSGGGAGGAASKAVMRRRCAKRVTVHVHVWFGGRTKGCLLRWISLGYVACFYSWRSSGTTTAVDALWVVYRCTWSLRAPYPQGGGFLGNFSRRFYVRANANLERRSLVASEILGASCQR